MMMCMLSVVMCKGTIEYITLEPARWQEYRDIRLEALLDSPQAYGTSYDEELQTSKEQWKERLGEAQQKKYRWMLFAQKDNRLIGSVGAYREKGERSGHLVTVINVYVKPGCRGKGIATQLLMKLINSLKEDISVKQAVLWVATIQKPAIALYQKCGFVVAGALANALKAGSNYYDYLLMQHVINSL